MPVITALSISPDGRTLATGHRDGSVALWDPHTWERQGTLLTQNVPVLALEFSPDGRRLACGTGVAGSIPNSYTPGVVNVWEVDDWKKSAVLRGHKGMIYGLAFAATGNTLVSSSGYDGGEVVSPGEVILWDTVTGQAHHLFSQDDNAAYAATISPDGKRIAVATRRGVHLLEPGTGTDRLLAKSTSTDFAHIAFSPDGNTLAWAEENCPVILLDASAGQQIATLAGRGPLAFCRTAAH